MTMTRLALFAFIDSPRCYAPVLMTCLLCDGECEMRRLSFKATGHRICRHVVSARDGRLSALLAGSGVCEDCFAKYEGQRHRTAPDINSLARATHPAKFPLPNCQTCLHHQIEQIRRGTPARWCRFGAKASDASNISQHPYCCFLIRWGRSSQPPRSAG